MTNTQFQILDELYFVTGFTALAGALGMSAARLKPELDELWQEGWIKVLFPNPDTEILPQDRPVGLDLGACYFLATKAGLLAHNTL